MESDPQYIVTLIGEIVASMRSTASILSFTDNLDGTYTVLVDSTKDLADNDYLTISNTTNFEGSYQVSSVVEDISFNIKKATGIATETGTWTADAPYYDYGHLVEIISKLQKSTSVKSKYPLIILEEDITEDRSDPEYYSEADFTIYICNPTNYNWTRQERQSNNFVAILGPLADSLIIKIKASESFVTGNEGDAIDETRINRPLWGVTGSGRNTGNKLSTPSDCIQLDLVLKVSNKYDNCILN